MQTDIEIRVISEQLLDCFNQRSAALPTNICDRSLSVTSALLGDDRRSNSLMHDPLGKLIAACQARFPGITFRSEIIRPSATGFISEWIGHSHVAEASDRPLKIPCTCRVTLQGHRVRHLWFSVDEYSILQQLGRLCPDPGQSVARSANVNQQAMYSLRDALTTREPARYPLGPDIVVHANLETYIDIAARGFQTEIFRLDGTGKITELLAYIQRRFSASLDLSFIAGISQGHTTTFRGTVRGRIGLEMQRYDAVFGFVTPAQQLTECWVKLTPPPTLMECLS